ncbi:hypothetical protein MVEN_01574200 [Mycena venus]|uniref:Uncharacterized protein n=1 Tax=Mycena venus TaxID=2733690 RepID=A0A8H6XPH6_9AGAR|nr:hypothetical protein MVEN_01574200 [Mycena venus]
MAAVMGDDEVSSHQFHRTPQPSIEDNGQPAATRTWTASTTVQKDVHDVRSNPSPCSTFTGYQALALFAELDQAVPHPGVARVLAEIQRLNFIVTGEQPAQIHGVESATWNHTEGLDGLYPNTAADDDILEHVFPATIFTGCFLLGPVKHSFPNLVPEEGKLDYSDLDKPQTVMPTEAVVIWLKALMKEDAGKEEGGGSKAGLSNGDHKRVNLMSKACE